jgi:hypothetical protein
VGHHIGIFPKNFLVKLIILGDFSPKNLDLADCGSPFWYFLPQNFLVALLSTFFLPPKQIPTHLRRTTPFQVESEPRHFHDELYVVYIGRNVKFANERCETTITLYMDRICAESLYLINGNIRFLSNNNERERRAVYVKGCWNEN